MSTEQTELIKTIQGEEWLPVSGYEGLYMVSNMGRVFSIKREATSGGILTPANTEGYFRVSLSSSNKKKSYLVHRLVLFAFVGDQPGGMEGSHLNGNPLDNRLENLVWESNKKNCSRREGHGHGQRGEKAPSAKLTWESVNDIRNKYKKVRQIDLAQQYGVHRATIQRIHSGEYWNE